MAKRKREDEGDGELVKDKHPKSIAEDLVEGNAAGREAAAQSTGALSLDRQQNEETPLRKRASLLGLPAELRNVIYFMVLNNNTGGYLDLSIDASNHQQPAILRTSRQIREEAIKIWYGNSFVLYTDRFKLEPQPEGPEHWIWHMPGGPTL
ncbi:uncharacterized protein LTR77_006119 [Saxophila tyrrhenica]|uniref:Uncharacterized protein n=1 Tax=Saxophila tyrrhenica TaxID=1690608 RepID=A0AAV9P7P0_9PEZI|nr:hypothetical protein LTR77_006119 [Saxophila tyrrhenica]